MEEISDETTGQLLLGLTAKSRRTKRAIPETEKDDQYWKRRCKNNIAAKKSRQNRRQHEFRLQSQVMQLEEENALLRKELETIKKRFNVSPDETMLSATDREECLKAVWLKSDQNVSDSSSKSLLYNSSHPIKREHTDDVYLENTNSLSEIFKHLPQFNLVPAHTQSETVSQGNLLRSYDVTSGNMSQTYNDPVTELENIRDSSSSSDEVAMPTDLTTKQKGHRSVHSSAADGTISGEVEPNKNGAKRKHDDAAEDDDGTTNYEIKTKLQILSDQVEKMQRLVTGM